MRDKIELRRLIGVIQQQIAEGTLFRAGFYTNKQLGELVGEAARDMDELAAIKRIARLDQWADSDGAVLWWQLPVTEPPYVGTPQDSGWPGYHTHWTALPRPSI